ncbi:MAG TPA: hypothetical protein VGB26_10895 [Nitrospiria bacterium]
MTDMKDVYIKSAAFLESSKDEFLSDGVTGFHYEFLSLKFMASLIHNDVCREFHNLTVNPTIGTSKVLSLGPIILKLFEANLWYSQVGNKKLRELAESRGMLEFMENKLKEMKLIRPSRIEKYAGIRNKLVGHYDDQIVKMLQELGATQSDNFFDDIEMMVRYSQEWLQALRSIGKLEVPENGI